MLFSKIYIYYKYVCAHSQAYQVHQAGSNTTVLIQQCYM